MRSNMILLQTVFKFVLWWFMLLVYERQIVSIQRRRHVIYPSKHDVKAGDYTWNLCDNFLPKLNNPCLPEHMYHNSSPLEIESVSYNVITVLCIVIASFSTMEQWIYVA